MVLENVSSFRHASLLGYLCQISGGSNFGGYVCFRENHAQQNIRNTCNVGGCLRSRPSSQPRTATFSTHQKTLPSQTKLKVFSHCSWHKLPTPPGTNVSGWFMVTCLLLSLFCHVPEGERFFSPCRPFGSTPSNVKNDLFWCFQYCLGAKTKISVAKFRNVEYWI